MPQRNCYRCKSNLGETNDWLSCEECDNFQCLNAECFDNNFDRNNFVLCNECVKNVNI